MGGGKCPWSNLLTKTPCIICLLHDSNLFASNSCHTHGNKITTESKIQDLPKVHPLLLTEAANSAVYPVLSATST